MRRTLGLSLVELLVILAVAGILVGIAAFTLNPNASATAQAAQTVAAAVNRARFEAIRSNSTAGFSVEGVAGGGLSRIVVCGGVDESETLSCGTGVEVFAVQFAGSDLGRARIVSPDELTLFFDRRGIIRNLDALAPIVIADRAGGNVRTVEVLASGRAVIR